MAERVKNVECQNEHAVADPDKIAAMVDMSVFSYVKPGSLEEKKLYEGLPISLIVRSIKGAFYEVNKIYKTLCRVGSGKINMGALDLLKMYGEADMGALDLLKMYGEDDNSE